MCVCVCVCVVKELELSVEPGDYLWNTGGEGFLKFVAMAVVNEGGATKGCLVTSRSVRVKVRRIFW